MVSQILVLDNHLSHPPPGPLQTRELQLQQQVFLQVREFGWVVLVSLLRPVQCAS